MERDAALVLLCIGLPWSVLIGSAILWRRSAGLPVVPRRPAEATFYSARARIGKAVLIGYWGPTNILVVSVTPAELCVSLAFPLNLTFLGQIWGVEHRVERTAVRAYMADEGAFGSWAFAEFKTADGLLHRLKLGFNDSRKFVRAIEGRV